MSIAEKFKAVADAVYDKGIADRDELIWKSMTMSGTRQYFAYFLGYSDWSGYEFVKPVKPVGGINHFFYSSTMIELPKNIDFSEILTVTTDSYAYRRDICAYSRQLEVFPDMNMRAIGGLESWFFQCYKLHTIELLRVNRNTIYSIDGKGSSGLTFGACNALENITFDGEIAQHISFKDSPLSVDSMKGIILNNLVNLAQEGLERKTITFSTTCWTNLEASGTPKDSGIDIDGTWRDYVNTLGWDT